MPMKSASIATFLITIVETALMSIGKTLEYSIIEAWAEEKREEEGKVNKNITETTHDNTLKTKHTK